MLGIASARLRGAAGGSARLEAEVLLARAAGTGREWLAAHPESTLSPPVLRRFRRWVGLRGGKRMPVAYLTGEKEFYGRSLTMRRGVFIPRPETEGLVERVEAWLRGRIPLPRGAVVVDACTGSGAVAVALAAATGVRVVATDISARALSLTRRNAERLGVGSLVRTVRSAGLPRLRAGESIVAVVANPPYVRTSELGSLPPDIRRHEPRAALAGGKDGLDVVRRLVREAGLRAAPGALLALEIAPAQGGAVVGLLRRGPWTGIRVEPDLSGRTRYVLALKERPNLGASGAGRPPLAGPGIRR